MSANQPARALDGIKVLDLSRVLAGPWSTQILADFGADVFKVELPGKGDDTRAWGPPYLTLPDGSEDPQESAYYLCANRNKRSAAIDLARPEGAALIRRLAAEADMLIATGAVDAPWPGRPCPRTACGVGLGRPSRRTTARACGQPSR